MAKIDVRDTAKPKIELYGFFGVFETPNNSIKIKFFSTAASSNKEKVNHSLLKELKPLRERINSKEMKNLNSLLQRDLNDYRVANELIPYLNGQISKIAFFPAILAVLIPKNFFIETIAYPESDNIIKNNSNNIFNKFGKYWELEKIMSNNIETNLGILSLYPDNTDVIVLDGQHRANAFRVQSKEYGTNNNIYASFYKNLNINDNYNSDLPVTLIWFESEEKVEVKPEFISRRLFVDVNNTARKVSESRSILLDDYDISSLSTRFVYSYLAEARSFTASKLSLLHSGFDLDTDIATFSGHALTLTNPQTLYYTLSWILFGTRYYNQKSLYRVGAERSKSNIGEFEEIFSTNDFSKDDIAFGNTRGEGNKLIINNLNKISNFENVFKIELLNVIIKVFDEFNIFKKQYEASNKLEEWVNNNTTTIKEVWEKVFCGGEGLYYTFSDVTLNEATETMKEYLKGINEVERQFKIIRAELFGQDESLVNKAYESINTKAFQVGLFMALDEFKENSTFIDSVTLFVDELNKIECLNWIYILTEIKNEIISGVDPKLWPAYQKIFLRIIKKDYYDKNNFLNSPDGSIFNKYILKKYNSWVEANEIDINQIEIADIGIGTLKQETKKWAKESKSEVDTLFKKYQIEPIFMDEKMLFEETINIIKNNIEKEKT